jgi:hypothetical protein
MRHFIISMGLLAGLTFSVRVSSGAITAGPQPGSSSTLAIYESPLGEYDLGPDAVTYDPNAGAIDKFFHDVEDRDNNGIVNGNDFANFAANLPVINEQLVVAGTPWTDWHEHIVTAGTIWANVNVAMASPGGPVPVPGLNVVSAGPDLDLTFDPLPAGSTLLIQKTLSPDPADNGQAFAQAAFPDFGHAVTGVYGTFEVLESPSSVPEPMTISILGIGAAALMARRPRRS